MRALSLRIRKARLQARLSQAELARRIGVNRAAVTQWEQPSGTTPSVEHLIQIALVTTLNFEWLATGRGASSSQDGKEAVPAVILDDFAQDADESQALSYLRSLSTLKRRTALEILKVLSR